MIYIYDLLLNFQDKNRLVEFFEWNDDDGIEQIKKIPLFRISTIDLNHFCFSDLKVDSNFLEKIKGKTWFYKRKKQTTYACLLSDLNRVVAVEFAMDGMLIARSCLLLDEEAQVIDDSKCLDEELISYKVLNENNNISFFTRQELNQKHYLEKELKILYNNKDIDMLTYLYEEIYGIDSSSFKQKYLKLLERLNDNFSFDFERLYNIIRLSYSNK